MENEKELVNKRRFLAGAGMGLLGLVGGGLYLFNKDSEANRILREFPNEIPGAREVRKYRTEGARYCLVHVLQDHYVDEEFYRRELISRGADEDEIIYMYKRDMNNVRNCQSDIYNILSYLIRNNGLTEVYVEGHTLEDEATINDIAKNVSLGLDINNRRALLDENTFKIGAACKLSFEGKIKLRGAEIRGSEEFNLRLFNLHNPKVQEKREDTLLTLVAKDNKSFSVVIYGRGHLFGGKKSFNDYNYESEDNKDNIYEWNTRNPDKKFSLIEVVPESYARFVKD